MDNEYLDINANKNMDEAESLTESEADEAESLTESEADEAIWEDDQAEDAAEEQELDERETEAARIARRMERRARMQKVKQRQLLVRKICKIAVPVLLGLGIVITVLVFFLNKNRTDSDNTKGTKQSELQSALDNDNYSDVNDLDGTLDTDAAVNSATADEGSLDKTDDAESLDESAMPADSEYGPYATKYSEEKDLFFEGYKVYDNPNSAVPDEEEVYSTYALLINAETGEIVAEKGSDTRINPASMTKIMTVLVAAERVHNLDDTFLIDSAINDFVYRNDCSAVYFATDEVVTVKDLMYGTILPSGADAAMALAEYVAGSEELFVGMMNDKLKELGLSDTAHFTNCVGIYDENHYCTLRDMAMIMKAAVENDLAREILSEHTYTTSKTPEHEDGLTISNWFLRRIEDKDTHGNVICAKTGFVNESGCCAASYEVSDSGGHYICVTADTWSAWRCIYDHVAMYSSYVE